MFKFSESLCNKEDGLNVGGQAIKISEAKRQVMLRQWTELIKEQKASGMKVNAWCKERGVGKG